MDESKAESKAKTSYQCRAKVENETEVVARN